MIQCFLSKNINGRKNLEENCILQWIPLKKTTSGQPKLVFIADWSLYTNYFTT